MKTLRTVISCLAIAAAVALFTIAASVGSSAQADGICTWIWQPVCGVGKDGKKHTWANDCWAKNDGAKHIKSGACK